VRVGGWSSEPKRREDRESPNAVVRIRINGSNRLRRTAKPATQRALRRTMATAAVLRGLPKVALVLPGNETANQAGCNKAVNVRCCRDGEMANRKFGEGGEPPASPYRVRVQTQRAANKVMVRVNGRTQAGGGGTRLGRSGGRIRQRRRCPMVARSAVSRQRPAVRGPRCCKVHGIMLNEHVVAAQSASRPGQRQ